MKRQRKKTSKGPTHVSTGNVLDDLGFSPEKAAVVKLRADIHSEILRAIKEHDLTPRQLEKVFNEPQPRISELLNGKISKMSVDKLTSYLYLLGKRVQITTKSRPLTREEYAGLIG